MTMKYSIGCNPCHTEWICDSAHFAFQNGPFRTAKWAVLQSIDSQCVADSCQYRAAQWHRRHAEKAPHVGRAAAIGIGEEAFSPVTDSITAAYIL